jgi:hypothetical protein
MNASGISPEAVSAQKLALVQQEVGVRVFKLALDAQAEQSLQLVQMMNQNLGIGTALDTKA